MKMKLIDDEKNSTSYLNFEDGRKIYSALKNKSDQ